MLFVAGGRNGLVDVWGVVSLHVDRCDSATTVPDHTHTLRISAKTDRTTRWLASPAGAQARQHDTESRHVV